MCSEPMEDPASDTGKNVIKIESRTPFQKHVLDKF